MSANQPVGRSSFNDVSGPSFAHSNLIINTSTTVALVNDGNNNIGVGTTIANGDIIRGWIVYEAAADA